MTVEDLEEIIVEDSDNKFLDDLRRKIYQ